MNPPPFRVKCSSIKVSHQIQKLLRSLGYWWLGQGDKLRPHTRFYFNGRYMACGSTSYEHITYPESFILTQGWKPKYLLRRHQ